LADLLEKSEVGLKSVNAVSKLTCYLGKEVRFFEPVVRMFALIRSNFSPPIKVYGVSSSI
jgi:hypothetical protein